MSDLSEDVIEVNITWQFLKLVIDCQ